MLDSIASRILAKLQSNKLDSQEELIDAATAIFTSMKEAGMREPLPENYYFLKNSYIHEAFVPLQGSLPITLTAVFCGLAQRIGISAMPVAYPGHVYAIVDLNPTFTTKSLFYFDLFSGQMVDRDELLESLRNLIQDEHQRQLVLRPVGTKDMLVRCSHNIRNSLQRRTPQGVECPMYNALALVLMMELDDLQPNLVDPLRIIIREFYPMDTGLVKRWILPRLAHADDTDRWMKVCEVVDDADKRPGKKQERTGLNVVFRVGDVFSHKRYMYTGIITGWTPVCAADDSWMTHMVRVRFVNYC